MAVPPPTGPEEELDTFTRVVHLGLMIFGVLAWLTVSLLLRLLYGFVGPANMRFREWFPSTRERLRLAWEDILTLLSFRLPERPRHQGLYGLVHAFGLAAFAWMALTGSLMFFFLKPGKRAGGLLHLVKEVHEVGWWLIAVFLALHVAGVVLHVLFGELNWRRMFFLKD